MIELNEMSAYVVNRTTKTFVIIAFVLAGMSLIKFVVSEVAPSPVVITRIQMVEGSQPISLPNGKVLMQCGVTGMDWLQMCDDAHRYTLKITGTACNVPPEELSATTKRQIMTWDSDGLSC